MYEELIEKLRDHNACIGIKTLDEAADAIEELKAAKCPHYIRNVHDRGDDSLCGKYKCEVNGLPRWIPVTERLPEDRQNCLCYSRLKSIRVLCFADNLQKIDEYDFANANRHGWFFFDSEYGYCEALGITHWMPLPEPQKEAT